MLHIPIPFLLFLSIIDELEMPLAILKEDAGNACGIFLECGRVNTLESVRSFYGVTKATIRIGWKWAHARRVRGGEIAENFVQDSLSLACAELGSTWLSLVFQLIFNFSCHLHQMPAALLPHGNSLPRVSKLQVSPSSSLNFAQAAVTANGAVLLQHGRACAFESKSCIIQSRIMMRFICNLTYEFEFAQ